MNNNIKNWLEKTSAAPKDPLIHLDRDIHIPAPPEDSAENNKSTKTWETRMADLCDACEEIGDILLEFNFLVPLVQDAAYDCVQDADPADKAIHDKLDTILYEALAELGVSKMSLDYTLRRFKRPPDCSAGLLLFRSGLLHVHEMAVSCFESMDRIYHPILSDPKKRDYLCSELCVFFEDLSYVITGLKAMEMEAMELSHAETR